MNFQVEKDMIEEGMLTDQTVVLPAPGASRPEPALSLTDGGVGESDRQWDRNRNSWASIAVSTYVKIFSIKFSDKT